MIRCPQIAVYIFVTSQYTDTGLRRFFCVPHTEVIELGEIHDDMNSMRGSVEIGCSAHGCNAPKNIIAASIDVFPRNCKHVPLVRRGKLRRGYRSANVAF